MPKVYILDKALKVGTLYRAERDKFLVVDLAATNSTTKARLKVAGTVPLELVDKIAQLSARDTERFPPLELKNLKVVVPPDKTIEVEGEAGKYIRVVGTIQELAPGGLVPAPFLARFEEQARKYYTYLEGINGIGEAATWVG